MVHWARAGIAIQHKLLMYANRQARGRDGLLPRFRYVAAKNGLLAVQRGPPLAAFAAGTWYAFPLLATASR